MEAGNGTQRAQRAPMELDQGTAESMGTPSFFEVMPNEQQPTDQRLPSPHGRQQGPMLTPGVIVVRFLLCVGLPLFTVALLEYATLLFSLSPGGDLKIPTLRVPESSPEMLHPIEQGALFGRGVDSPDVGSLSPPARERMEALMGVKRKRTPKSCWSQEELPLFLKVSPLQKTEQKASEENRG